MKLKQLIPPDWFLVSVAITALALLAVAYVAKQSAQGVVPL